MTEKRFEFREVNCTAIVPKAYDNEKQQYANLFECVHWLNDLNDENKELKQENEQLKSNLRDCKKLKTKRLNKIRNHRAVIEDLGGSIRAYKGKLGQANEKIEKIKEAMENTGALTKRQLEEILND